MNEKRIILAGTPDTTVIVANTLLKNDYAIVSVLCPFPKPVGRKQVLTPCALEVWANENDIPIVHVNKEILNNPDMINTLPLCDLLIVADFGFLIPKQLLSFPKYGSLNIHPSLLPRWRGASPVPFTILFNEKETGVTIISMSEKFDVGEIVSQVTYKRTGNEYCNELLYTLFELGADLLVRTIPDYIHGKTTPKKQPKESPTPYARKFTKDDGFIPLQALYELMNNGKTEESIPLLHEYNLHVNTRSVLNMISALTPWPGVWSILSNGKRAKILKAEEKEGKLVLLSVQIEGKNPTAYKDVKHYF